MNVLCGTTRSGRSIYENATSEERPAVHPCHQNFTADDHFDAFAVFTFLAIKYIRRYGKRDHRAESYEGQASLHRSILMETGAMSDAVLRSGIKTMFELTRFAQRLVWPGYRMD